MLCHPLKSPIEHLNPSLHLELGLSYLFPFCGISHTNLRLLPLAKKHPQLLTGQQCMHTWAAAAPLCAWKQQSLESRESHVVQPDVCRMGGFSTQQASRVQVGPAKWQKPYVPPTPAHFTALQLGQGSPACIRSLLCPWPSCLRKGGRQGILSALAPVPEAEEPLAKSTRKTIEVNLKVSLVCLGFLLFSFPLFYCVSCLLFLFFTGLASILLLQLKLCPVTELHIGFA